MTLPLGKRGKAVTEVTPKNSRYRKKPKQMDVLWQVFKQHKGKMPPRKLRVELASQLNMREN